MVNYTVWFARKGNYNQKRLSLAIMDEMQYKNKTYDNCESQQCHAILTKDSNKLKLMEDSTNKVIKTI